jgi:hypothetical protein
MKMANKAKKSQRNRFSGEITGAGVLNGMVHGFLLTPD